ncbi:alpha/beta hydrolase [Bacillus sp. FJAT-28004]|uniref:alpha/beta hydrolase n=1 Tax=Bacillus sp. FJAT-28004 TaxID=1679165 RepID=UPI0006B51C85|nr:alpha/beta hydrolase [Bacillus sp. FJAT-28004]
MKISVIPLTNENVTLTAYLLDPSLEMRNADVRPAVLICPGGAYYFCSDREAEPIAMSYLAEGYHAFVLRYSLFENAAFPRPLNDAEEALELIRKHSEEWGVDPDKIAVCGFSAGGHLAASLGTMGSSRPNALILGYPCILSTMNHLLRSPMPAVDEHVDASTPPAFIFHTFEDAVVPVNNALAFATAMSRAEVPFELHIFQNGVHGLSLATPSSSGGMGYLVNADFAHWFKLSTAWLRNRFGDFETNGELVPHTIEYPIWEE